jgi:hypothetical protein
MSLKGKWRITKMPDFVADYPDMVEPAYILFEDEGSGEFAFGCCTGQIWEASNTEATSIFFSWSGCDEMEQVEGEGSAELQPNGSLHGAIEYQNGDELAFIAEKWTSSTAC